MDQTESAEILGRAREGSRDALDTLFELCGGKLLALIRLRMGPSLRARLESRDILQETMLAAFQRLPQLEGETSSSLMAWLARIAENEIRDQAEFHGRQKRDLARELPVSQAVHDLRGALRTASSELVLGEQLESLERALEGLPAAHREVILLRRLEELSYTEIGERLGKSPDACRMLFARAMAALTVRMRGPR